jgi:hypothetical protein
VADVSGLVDDLLLDGIVDIADIAAVADTTARSVSRWRGGVSPRRSAEERLLELNAVVELLRQVLRDEPRRLWMKSPNPDLDYEKPLELIERGEYRRVVGAVLAMAEGVTD